SLRRLGLLEEREQLPDLAQRFDRLFAHTQRDAPRRAEEIAEHWDRVRFRLLEKKRRTALLEHTVANLGRPKHSVDLGPKRLQFAAALELREKIAKIGVFHRGPFALGVVPTRRDSLSWRGRRDPLRRIPLRARGELRAAGRYAEAFPVLERERRRAAEPEA